jgi:hypothetical protein
VTFGRGGCQGLCRLKRLIVSGAQSWKNAKTLEFPQDERAKVEFEGLPVLLGDAPAPKKQTGFFRPDETKQAQNDLIRRFGDLGVMERERKKRKP